MKRTPFQELKPNCTLSSKWSTEKLSTVKRDNLSVASTCISLPSIDKSTQTGEEGRTARQHRPKAPSSASRASRSIARVLPSKPSEFNIYHALVVFFLLALLAYQIDSCIKAMPYGRPQAIYYPVLTLEQ